jgi:uncharacterized membrane protein (DUF441 family)
MTRLQCFIKASKAGFFGMSDDLKWLIEGVGIVIGATLLVLGFFFPILCYTIGLSYIVKFDNNLAILLLIISILAEYPWLKCIFFPAANCILNPEVPVNA